MVSVFMLSCMLQPPTLQAAGIHVNDRYLNLDINVDQTINDSDMKTVREGLVGKNNTDIDVNCDNEQNIKDLIAMKVFLETNYGKDNEFSVTDKQMLEEDGVMIREVNLEAGLDKKNLQICYFSDTHFKSKTEDGNLSEMLKFSNSYDQIVLGGDMVEQYSMLDQLAAEIEPYKDKTIMVLGSHETMDYSGKSTDAERVAKVNSLWHHNANYFSKLLEDRVMLIQINNSRGEFLEEQIALFQSDISLAKNNRYKVLLFVHEPLCVSNPAQSKVNPIYLSPERPDLYNYYYVRGVDFNACQGKDAEGATKSIYDIIVQNADTIKAVFAGHLHADFYTEISAKNSDGSSAKIPQYNVCSANNDNGHAIIININ